MKLSDIRELLADPISGLFLLIALLCLGYLFAAVNNWADPSKPDPTLKRTLVVVTVLLLSLAMVFVRGAGAPGEASISDEPVDVRNLPLSKFLKNNGDE